MKIPMISIRIPGINPQNRKYGISILVGVCVVLSTLLLTSSYPTMAKGSEIETINPISTQSRDQALPVAAYAPQADEYLVVFERIYSTVDHDIFAIRVDNGGLPIGTEIPIDEDGYMDAHPGVAYSPLTDEFLVVWENEYEQNINDHDIYGQRMNVDGTKEGGEIHIAYDGNYDTLPVVTYNPGTQQFLVVFERRMGADEFAQRNLMGVRVDSYGNVVGGATAIASGDLDEVAPCVASDGTGYLVAWQGDYQDQTNIYGQLIDSEGGLLGSQISISTWSGDQLSPQVAYNSDDGQYFVVWEDHHYSPWEIYGYRLNQSGGLVGSQVNIGVTGTKNQSNPGVTYLPGLHSYQVVWQYEYLPTDNDIATRRVAYDGTLPEATWYLDQSYSNELHPAVTSDAWMRILAVWEDWFNYQTTGVDIYGSVETIIVPTFSGGVYVGNAGDFSQPLPGVTVQLGCSHTYGYFGDIVAQMLTNPQGQYQLQAAPMCEFYNIQEIDPGGYYSTASQTIGGHIFSSNWIYYDYPLQGLELSSNNYWDQVSGPVDNTPPGNWANFSPQGWTNTRTVNVSVRVEDTFSGLAVGTAMYSYTRDSGQSWSDWIPAQCTGGDGTTQAQTISASVSFDQDSNPADKNQVRFLIYDMAGNPGQSPDYTVSIDTVTPEYPSNLNCPTHPQSVWYSNNVATCNWSPATDATSGIAGYSIRWTQNSGEIPDEYVDVIGTQATSEPLNDGYWYFMVRSVDQAGNASLSALTYSFKIDTTPPTAWFTEPASGSHDHLSIHVVWDGVDTHSGIYAYDVQYMVEGEAWTDWRMWTNFTSADYSGQRGQTVSFRVRATDIADNTGNWSEPITVHIGVTVNTVVKNESQITLSGADVYLNDTIQGYTSVNGRLSVADVLVGDQLSARYFIAQHVASKDYHNWIYGPGDWSYRIYITSVNFDGAGYPEIFTVTNPLVDQVLIVRRDNPLIGFYALVSVEWDANDEYLNQLSATFRAASDLMLDLTDGQMYFEVVDIWDNKVYYTEADYHVDASNHVRPKAHVGGVWKPDPYHLFFGRDVDKEAVIHEWGHYGFDLYDEYRNADGGSEGAGCTLDVKTTPYAIAASIMDKSYITTELCSELTLHPHNTNTQQQAERGGPTWNTLYDRYKDSQNPPRWILERPNDRGAIMAGPGELPVDDWYKTRVIGMGSYACEPFITTWILPDNSPAYDADVWVRGSGDLWEGLAKPPDPKFPASAEVEILGAHNGDKVVATKDCGIGCTLSAKVNVSCPLGPLSEQMIDTISAPISMQLDPFSIDVQTQFEADGLTLGITALTSILLPAPPSADVWQEGGESQTVTLSFDGSKYIGSVVLNPTLGLKGYVVVTGMDGHANEVSTTIAYQAQQVLADDLTWLISGDGQMEVFISPGSLPDTPVVSIDESYTPNWEQGDLKVLGKAYQVSVAGGINSLSQPAVVSINFSMGDLSPGALNYLSLYRWDPLSESWVKLDSEVGTEINFISAEVDQLGIFAILKTNTQRLMLPLIIR